jgi:hypothetical protein
MKRLILAVAVAIMSITFFPAQTNATPEKPATSVAATKPADEAEAKALTSRLYEINAMDKSKLSSSQKKDLKKEVKSIRTKLHDISGGVYISGAAVVIIVVILLILL